MHEIKKPFHEIGKAFEVVHGGDIYQNQVTSDFSINVNPLGTPEGVKNALLEAVEHCDRYPDIHAASLKKQIGEKNGVKPEQIICGNGASELLMALVHGIRPKRILIPVPSFYGYEWAAKAVDAKVSYYKMKQEDGFALTEAFLPTLTKKIDLVFLANPNNPVGNLLNEELLFKICCICQKKNIILVIDECFLEFTKQKSWASHQKWVEYPNVVVLRAFTKFYGMAGVRLGYLLCSSKKLCIEIERQLPEWNLSSFAQAAGVAALKEEDYEKETLEYVERERSFLTRALIQSGIKVLNSSGDYLMIYGRKDLYDKLLKEGILIRDCSNFRGLKKGYFRIGVKTHEENEKLMETVEKILGTD